MIVIRIFAFPVAALGVVVLVGSGMCTLGFGVSGIEALIAGRGDPGIIGVALLVGAPGMAVGYGLFRLGRWIMAPAAPKPTHVPPQGGGSQP